MLLNIAKNGAKIFRTSLLTLCCLSITACSSIKISYITRGEAKSASFAQERPRFVEKKPLSLGAIRFIRKDAKEGEMGQIFFLQRRKGIYMAETKLYDTGKKRFFFSFGMDLRGKKPTAAFRMEF